jgi:hypothetical protein
MNHWQNNACAICGEEQCGGEARFLLAENRRDDKLTILQWSEDLATREGIQIACSVNHVEELVIHWMTTGSLDHPFARTTARSEGRRRRSGPDCSTDLSGARQIGELAVHRESLKRVLVENPQALQAILGSLLVALRREAMGHGDGISRQDHEEGSRAVSWKA